MNAKPVLLAVAVLFAFVTSVQAECDRASLPAQFAEVASSAQQRVTKGELPSIAIAIAQYSNIVCEEAFGWADRAKHIRATPTTVYAAGSVAKAVTGTGVFLLADKGKIQLDDAPEQHGVQILSYAGSGITIRQLLTMTAGIQHGWFYDYGATGPPRQLLSRYAISAYPPGTHFNYSNFSYGILGEIIERTAQRSFRDFMRDDLFIPLHMTSSGFNLRGHNVAVGYQKGKPVPAHTFQPEAGGGLFASAHDLALFGRHSAVLGLGPSPHQTANCPSACRSRAMTRYRLVLKTDPWFR